MSGGGWWRGVVVMVTHTLGKESDAPCGGGDALGGDGGQHSSS